MNIKRDILDPSWMCLDGTFDQQVARLFEHVRLSRHQVEEDLLSLFNDVENVLEIRWPGCRLTPYGSLYQGTGFKTSDVDCFIDVPIQDNSPTDSLVITAKELLSHRPDVFAQMSAATNVTVPIVKFFHLPTNRRCDLTFNSPPGATCNQLVWYLLHLDKRALDLAVLVKYWAKVHNFTGPYLLRSYTLILMVIFYLQQINMLPTVQTLQRNVPFVSWRDWNVAFESIRYSNNNQSSLKQLLGGFLLFFNAFNFDNNVISLFVGRTIDRERFKKVSDVSDDFQLYKDNVKHSLCEALQVDSPMCVQDVFDHSSNCCDSVSPELAHYIKECLRSAAELYKSESDGNFLKAILSIRCKPSRNTVMPISKPKCIKNSSER